MQQDQALHSNLGPGSRYAERYPVRAFPIGSPPAFITWAAPLNMGYTHPTRIAVERRRAPLRQTSSDAILVAAQPETRVADLNRSRLCHTSAPGRATQRLDR